MQPDYDFTRLWLSGIWDREGKEMNTNAADNLVNAIYDKHPFTTGTLLIMVVGAMLIVYGVFFLILRKKK
jgi:hypothetical protein